MADAGALEERTVEVRDPSLSDEANARLTEAVREVIGTDTVRVPADRARVSRGEKGRVSWYDNMGIFRAASVGSFAVVAGVAMVILTTGDHWYLLAIAFVVLVIALASVTRTIIGLAGLSEYPDPFLVAYLGEQGVRDPEARFTELVHEFTPLSTGESRSTSVEDDPATAASEQRESGTPAGGATSAVGPGGSS